MSLLITRPRHDNVTHYFYYWGGLIIDAAKKRGIKVIDLEKKKATKTKLRGYLLGQKPSIVILNGHGNSSEIGGHDNEVILNKDDATELFKDKIFFMRACSSGQVLGPTMVSSKVKAKAFIGYKELFRFWTDNGFFKDPLNDNFAKPFLDTSNQVALSLIKGKTAKEAHEDSMAVYRQEIVKLLNSNAENSFVVADLIWNMSHQVCLE